jgi:hypothetical protein
MQFWTDLLSSPTILIAALLIGTLGEVMKRAVNSKEIEAAVVAYHENSKKSPAPAMWKRIFYYSLPAHPVLVGVALGFVPWLPAEEALSKPGYDMAAHLGTYILAGVVCKIGYDTIISTLKRVLKGGIPGGSKSSPPPPAPADGGNA